jgi:hypothetical protein
MKGGLPRPEKPLELYHDHAKLLARNDIQAVVIASPEHLPQAVVDSRGGKSTSCSKSPSPRRSRMPTRMIEVAGGR